MSRPYIQDERALTDIAAAVDPSGSDVERLAGAIQDPTRRSILLAFYKTNELLTVDQVATRARVHRTVAFAHLERLVALGYLTTSQRRGLPGKPAKLYQRASDEPLLFRYPMRQAVLLAKLLAASLSGLGESGIQAAKEAARACGSELGDGRARSVPDALRALDSLGGDYHLEGDRVVARNCVFRETCLAAPDLVCGVHSGIIEGAFTASGLNYEITPRGVCGSGGCSFALTARHS